MTMGSKPPLTIEKILEWAGSFHRRTGEWPQATSGLIPEADGDSWDAVNHALRLGYRGLSGGCSLYRLLAQERGASRSEILPPLRDAQILEWAEAHFRRVGEWPSAASGPIEDAPTETWANIDRALFVGRRGLPKGGSLAELLERDRRASSPGRRRPLSMEKILEWANSHYRRTGAWPQATSGLIPESEGDTWGAVNHALRLGYRGLSGGCSLYRLLAQERGASRSEILPPLRDAQILEWAEAHFRRVGEWPSAASGPIEDAPTETWANIDRALFVGRRGLPKGGSLAELLERDRRASSPGRRRPLSMEKILEWANSHYRRTGAWPQATSGLIPESEGDTWGAVNHALRYGYRGLPGGSSLCGLLAEQRGASRSGPLQPLRESQILEWAAAHFRRMGQWPRVTSGSVNDAPGESWANINRALSLGRRSLLKGGSLAQLIERESGVSSRANRPPLSMERILEWADSHNLRTGEWPHANSGLIPEAEVETWIAVNNALYHGYRGLLGGSSLSRLLSQERGARNPKSLPPLDESRILEWADVHFPRTGKWPNRTSGAVEESPGETWYSIARALSLGLRGLPKGGSLSELLAREKGVLNPDARRKLPVDEIPELAAGD